MSNNFVIFYCLLTALCEVRVVGICAVDVVVYFS